MQIKYIPPAVPKVKARPLSLVPLLWAALIVSALVFSADASDHVKRGINLCLGTVIPSLFPFMVISSLITAAGAGRQLGRLLERPFRLLFGTSGAAACPVLLGFVCGYPIGASTAAAMLDSGEITKSELERLLTFINVPSAAFVIVAVGTNMLSSRELGIAVYVSVLISAVTAGVVGRAFFRKNGTFPHETSASPESIPLSLAVTEAIRKAAVNMLSVSACVVTFSAVSGTVCSLPLFAAAPQWARAILTGFFEVSSGAGAAASAKGIAAPLISAAICSWSGLSVHMQIISACRGRGISFLPFFISKAVQALLSPALLYIYLKFIV